MILQKTKTYLLKGMQFDRSKQNAYLLQVRAIANFLREYVI